MVVPAPTIGPVVMKRATTACGAARTDEMTLRSIAITELAGAAVQAMDVLCLVMV
jgi:hypothetical protein